MNQCRAFEQAPILHGDTIFPPPQLEQHQRKQTPRCSLCPLPAIEQPVDEFALEGVIVRSQQHFTEKILPRPEPQPRSER